MDGRVLVRMNVLGIDLTIDQVDAVLCSSVGCDLYSRANCWISSVRSISHTCLVSGSK
jgi:hypothetical protein